MNFQEANTIIQTTNADYQKGVMEERVWKAKLASLVVHDRYRNVWKYFPESGEWLYKDRNGWKRAIPDAKDPAPLWRKILRVSARAPVPATPYDNNLLSYLGWLVKGYWVNLPYTLLFQIITTVVVFFVARFAHTLLYLNIINSGKTMLWQTVMADHTKKLIETHAWNMMVAGITETTWALFGFLISFLAFKAFNGSLVPFFKNLFRLPLWTASCFSDKDRNNLLVLAVAISLAAFSGRFFETEYAALITGLLLLISFGSQQNSVLGTAFRLLIGDLKRLFRLPASSESKFPYLILLGSSIGLVLFFFLYQQPFILYAVMGFSLLMGWLIRVTRISKQTAMMLVGLFCFGLVLAYCRQVFADDNSTGDYGGPWNWFQRNRQSTNDLGAGAGGWGMAGAGAGGMGGGAGGGRNGNGGSGDGSRSGGDSSGNGNMPGSGDGSRGGGDSSGNGNMPGSGDGSRGGGDSSGNGNMPGSGDGSHSTVKGIGAGGSGSSDTSNSSKGETEQYVNSDGSITTIYSDGTRMTEMENGNKTFEHPDGSHVLYNKKDGTSTRWEPNGSKMKFYPNGIIENETSDLHQIITKEGEIYNIPKGSIMDTLFDAGKDWAQIYKEFGSDINRVLDDNGVYDAVNKARNFFKEHSELIHDTINDFTPDIVELTTGGMVDGLEIRDDLAEMVTDYVKDGTLPKPGDVLEQAEDWVKLPNLDHLPTGSTLDPLYDALQENPDALRDVGFTLQQVPDGLDVIPATNPTDRFTLSSRAPDNLSAKPVPSLDDFTAISGFTPDDMAAMPDHTSGDNGLPSSIHGGTTGASPAIPDPGITDVQAKWGTPVEKVPPAVTDGRSTTPPAPGLSVDTRLPAEKTPSPGTSAPNGLNHPNDSTTQK